MAQLGRAGRLGRSGCRFKSCHLDVAKNTTFRVGDEVRLKINIEYGSVQIRKITKGQVKKVYPGGMFSTTKYDVQWPVRVNGKAVILQHIEKDLDFSQQAQGGVRKG